MKEKNRTAAWSTLTMFIAKSFRNKQSPCTVSCSLCACLRFCCLPLCAAASAALFAAHDPFFLHAEGRHAKGPLPGPGNMTPGTLM